MKADSPNNTNRRIQCLSEEDITVYGKDKSGLVEVADVGTQFPGSDDGVSKN